MSVTSPGSARADLPPGLAPSGAPVAQSDPAFAASVLRGTDGIDRLAAPASDAVLAMNGPPGGDLATRIAATVKRGIALAARDGSQTVRTLLADAKNDALVLGGAAVVAGVQLVPGVDLAADAALGLTGAAMYAAAGREHQAHIGAALHALRDYAGEVASAVTPATQDYAAHDFARFLKTGSVEGAEALGAIGSAAAAPGRIASAARKVEELGGLDGVIAAGRQHLDATSGAAHGVFTAAGTWLDQAAAGLAPSPALAAAHAGLATTHAETNDGVLMARARGTETTEAPPAPARGARPAEICPRAAAAARRNRDLKPKPLAMLAKLKFPLRGELPFEPPKRWNGTFNGLFVQEGPNFGFKDVHGNIWQRGVSRTLAGCGKTIAN